MGVSVMSEPSKVGRSAIVGFVLVVLGAAGYALVQEMTKDAYNVTKDEIRKADLQLPRMGTPCSKCGGSGWVEVDTDRRENGAIRSRDEKCSVCGGTGKQP
jgi:hypothetical protein